MSVRILTRGDVVTVFIYRLGKTRAECSCGWEGPTRMFRGVAVGDAYLHSDRVGCQPDMPLQVDERARGARWWQKLTPWPVAAALPLLLIPAGIWLAPLVHADPGTDRAYIATLDHFGVYYESEAAAIATGHSICRAFDAGVPLVKVVRAGVRAGFTSEESSYEVGAAVGAYCPGYKSLFDQEADS